MEKFADNEGDENRLRFENELKKIKLTLEHGAQFFNTSRSDLSPELEGLWLDQIQKFEDAYKNRKSILLYDKIERPEFRLENEIPENEIKMELERIRKILSDHQIEVDTIYEVNEREVYRFITEDLFNKEIDDITIKGMVVHFIYEEFYPNHAGDLKNLCREFIDDVLNKETEIYPDYISLANRMLIETGDIDPEQLIKNIESFRGKFNTFKLNHFRILSLKITGKNAEVDFYIRFSGISDKDQHKKSYSGKGRFGFIYKYEFWFISEMIIPGII